MEGTDLDLLPRLPVMTQILSQALSSLPEVVKFFCAGEKKKKGERETGGEIAVGEISMDKICPCECHSSVLPGQREAFSQAPLMLLQMPS